MVEKHIEGLGFALQDKGKKTATILMAAKYEDYRQMLALAHYSLRLSSYFVFEQCFAFLIMNHYASENKAEPIKAKEMYESGMQLADIFRSEHIIIDSLNMETFKERFSFMADAAILNLDKETMDIRLTDKPSPLLDLFA